MPAAAHRLLALPHAAQDALLAALLAALGGTELALAGPDAGSAALGAVALTALAVGVLLRRRRPLVALVVGFAAMGAAQQDPVLYDTTVPFLALVVFPYSVARHSGDRPWPSLALAVAVTVAVLVLSPDGLALADAVFGLAVVVGAPWVAGRLVRSRALLARALAERAERLRREREAAEAQAVLDERTRIAGDLHDVITHALSAMTVQASAAGRLARRDADAARGALEAVETTGREALGELRRVLGVLRRADEDLALAPQPSLANLGSLLARTRRAGLPVALEADGDAPAGVPAGVDLTAFRVVQAALAAAREAEAGSAAVAVRWAPGAVELAVTDDGRPGDRDLLGMRERVRLYDGDLHAASLEGGGHAVRARLPVEAPA